MTDLSAAFLTAFCLTLCANVWVAIGRRLGWRADPRRAWKWVQVTYRQSSKHDRLNVGLFVALLAVIVWGIG
jgi:hypothetical protein